MLLIVFKCISLRTNPKTDVHVWYLPNSLLFPSLCMVWFKLFPKSFHITQQLVCDIGVSLISDARWQIWTYFNPATPGCCTNNGCLQEGARGWPFENHTLTISNLYKISIRAAFGTGRKPWNLKGRSLCRMSLTPCNTAFPFGGSRTLIGTT